MFISTPSQSSPTTPDQLEPIVARSGPALRLHNNCAVLPGSKYISILSNQMQKRWPCPLVAMIIKGGSNSSVILREIKRLGNSLPSEDRL